MERVRLFRESSVLTIMIVLFERLFQTCTGPINMVANVSQIQPGEREGNGYSITTLRVIPYPILDFVDSQMALPPSAMGDSRHIN